MIQLYLASPDARAFFGLHLTRAHLLSNSVCVHRGVRVNRPPPAPRCSSSFPATPSTVVNAFVAGSRTCRRIHSLDQPCLRTSQRCCLCPPPTTCNEPPATPSFHNNLSNGSQDVVPGFPRRPFFGTVPGLAGAGGGGLEDHRSRGHLRGSSHRRSLPQGGGRRLREAMSSGMRCQRRGGLLAFWREL